MQKLYVVTDLKHFTLVCRINIFACVRLELTGFIKEVRHNKHGSLTGLSLEDIVTSVSELVEQKKKVIR